MQRDDGEEKGSWEWHETIREERERIATAGEQASITPALSKVTWKCGSSKEGGYKVYENSEQAKADECLRGRWTKHITYWQGSLRVI